MRTFLANIAMVLITAFGLVLMGVVKIIEGVVWLVKPAVMFWQWIRRK